MTIKWQTLGYSKKAVKRAIKELVENTLSFEEKLECRAIVANFRSSHSYPMQSMIGHFRKVAFAVDKNAVVVCRLKRLPSIINKLKRFPAMQVTTMTDIGGIRIITKNLKNVYRIQKKIVESRTRNRLVSKKNYLKEPKASGYRGIHLNYAYQGKKEEYHGFRVELQIRSEIQHAWSTAVEVVGTLKGQNLKAGIGDPEWLEFFKSISSAFACLENNEDIDISLRQDIEQKIDELNVFNFLETFRLAARDSGKTKGSWLLQLDMRSKEISARYFDRKFSSEAYDEYRRIEQEISENTEKDVVVVSAESLKDLKKAYPNYFADTKFFLDNLKRVIQKNGQTDLQGTRGPDPLPPGGSENTIP